nr:FHIPEP family type III secretion protein [Thermobrachium celere]
MHKSIHGSYPAIDPNITTKIYQSIQENIQINQFNNDIPVILVSPNIRAAFRKMIEMVFPQIQVLSMNEIPTDAQIETLGMVTAE